MTQRSIQQLAERLSRRARSQQPECGTAPLSPTAGYADGLRGTHAREYYCDRHTQKNIFSNEKDKVDTICCTTWVSPGNPFIKPYMMYEDIYMEYTE